MHMFHHSGFGVSMSWGKSVCKKHVSKPGLASGSVLRWGTAGMSLLLTFPSLIWYFAFRSAFRKALRRAFRRALRRAFRGALWPGFRVGSGQHERSAAVPNVGSVQVVMFAKMFSRDYSDCLVPLVVSVQVVMTAKMLSRDHSDFWCLM